MNKEVIFPYYSGNIYKSNCIGFVTLEQFIHSHKNPTNKTKSIINKVNHAAGIGDKKLKFKYKKQLHTFTPSVMIDACEQRRYDNIQSFTGLMQIDLDGIPDRKTTIDLKEHIFHTHPELVACYVSPSRLGIKALMRIKAPIITGALHSLSEAIREYKALHKAVEKVFNEYGYFDIATRNAILPLFLSVDENILYRDIDECEIWEELDWTEKDYVQLNNAPAQNDFTDSESKYYYDKTVRLLESKINAISDEGHPQVRTAGLILGSRVGAGYIDYNDAISRIEYLITGNSYLKKGIKGYVKTANWAINEGTKNPKYYK